MDQDYPPRPRFSLAIPAALAALGIGTVVGVVIGYAMNAMFTEPTVVVPPPQVIKDTISEEDLIALCEELTDDEKAKVVQAHERVQSLESELQAREAELSKLKQEAQGDETKRKAAAKKWREMEQEIARLQVELAAATEERDELRVELRQTLKSLDKQIAETKKFKAKAIHYQQESTKNLWAAFVNNGKVQICDRGTRKRHAKCHEAVEAAMNADVMAKFGVCVDTYQAVPVLKQAEKKSDALPQFADWLPDDNKFTKKGWYIIYCDPSLPEARDLELEGDGTETTPSRDVDDEDMGLEPLDIDLSE